MQIRRSKKVVTGCGKRLVPNRILVGEDLPFQRSPGKTSMRMRTHGSIQKAQPKEKKTWHSFTDKKGGGGGGGVAFKTQISKSEGQVGSFHTK